MFDPVKVEMKNPALWKFVFVYNRKRGTFDGVIRTQFQAKPLNESGFTRSQITINCENFAPYTSLQDFFREALCLCFRLACQAELSLFVPGFHLFFRSQSNQGYNHFFHADASMLEGVFEEIYVMIVIVGIGKKVILRGKHIG